MSEAILKLDNLHKRFGSRVSADGFSLTIQSGEFFTLLGPSGSGKSTILRMIGGLETPDSGKIYVRGKDVTGIPPWDRRIGMVFQHYANFPHMNVEENIAYGLRRSSSSKSEIKARVEELLTLVGMSGFETRRVTQLSGGEQQRIAIARALAPKPAILLLDEPLSALDEKIRREMQDELRNIQVVTNTTFIYVTHDQEEALTMSDRIAVLNQGLCIQCAAPADIFQRPKTAFVANFFRGSNVLNATLGNEGAGSLSARFGGGTWNLDGPHTRTGVEPIAIRSEAILLGEQAQNADVSVTATIESATYRGVYTSYRLKLEDDQHLIAVATRQTAFEEGTSVSVGINASDIVVLERD